MESLRPLSVLILMSSLVGCTTNTDGQSGCGPLTRVSPSCEAKVYRPVKLAAYLDDQEQKGMQSSPRTLQRMERGEPLSVSDIIKLHENGVRDETILRYMQNTCAVYQISEPQIRRLRDAGVGCNVINYMAFKESYTGSVSKLDF